MVKYEFPGQPGKPHKKSRQSSRSANDLEGQRAGQDAYLKLSIFNLLFEDDDEGSSFHGFSPHSIESSRDLRKTNVETKNEEITFYEPPKEVEKPKIKKQLKKDDKNTPTTTKFVLPSRSVHSSRVIKPNKRFFQNDNDPTDLKKTKIEKIEPKCILRKPMLNIKSETSSIEGPFSSPGNSSIAEEQVHSAKVVCGVCGTMRPCKSYRQAKKFGIFSCDPCRRFIIKIIHKEKNNLLNKLSCDTRTGNCSIRIAAFASPFSPEPPENEKTRCHGCWLNQCLRSYKLPLKITTRLSSYLPLEISHKTALFENMVKWSDKDRSDTLSKESEFQNIKKKPVKIFKEPNFKKKNKKVNSGPRVKHVCRSASLVLGQTSSKPVQTPKNTEEIGDKEVETIIPEIRIEDEEIITQIVQGKVPKDDIEVLNKSEPKETTFERPIARMLQDLGRDNCDLLDGIERHESLKRFAKVSIDFWESYDPDEVAQMGFSLLAFGSVKAKALCFLCGSAGFEKLIHCASCCEPYHTFCVTTLKSEQESREWWKIDWICPRCCECEICSKTGAQLSCAKCSKNYHSNCVPSGRANTSENWVCPSCLYCKSCNDPTVHVFVGNMPLCKGCFKLRKQGSYCPLCQICYDDNDYSTKMMECAACNSWIHAKCEGLSNEKYQVLSYLPSSVEFICKLCCKNPPPFWYQAVNSDLKAGYLNVIKSLSKNRLLCSLVKASPKKRVCDCQDVHRKPIHLRNLTSHMEDENYSSRCDTLTRTVDDKNSDLGLLTPKLTKDDEESLKTVKTEFLDLVNKEETNNLLSIAYKSDLPVINVEENINITEEKKCTCNIETSLHQTLSLMGIKNRAMNDEYTSVLQFNTDMEKVINEINESELTALYQSSLKQVFPWFDPNEDNTDMPDLDTSLNEKKEIRKSIEVESPRKALINESIKNLLIHEPDYYYHGLKIQDTRYCMFCKMIGEGEPEREGRLLYCGLNEWVHANCALWSSEVFEEIDGSLQNVHSAISRARLIRCSGCDKKGASVGCCAKSCPYAYHFSCALNAECVFSEKMEVYCKTHKNKLNEKKRESFSLSRSVYVELDRKKKKVVLFNEVCLNVGSLTINSIGEIIPEVSDSSDFIIPCEYSCTRLYWSAKEPWKIVQYHIKTKLTKSNDEYCFENDKNYTLDHTLEFTPPPSPIEVVKNYNAKDYNAVKNVLNFLVDTVSSKEEENDLLPPELEEAIFEDLPHDLLDRISMNDIFTKMNFDDDKIEIGESSIKKPLKYSPLEAKNPYFKSININKMDKQENYLERGKSWKKHNILQVDGAMDFSESESNDSSDVQNEEEEPVKCARCRRTYRSSVGYERHLPTCSDYLTSSAESESSEEEKTQDSYPCQNVDYVQVLPKPVQNPPIILQQVPDVPTYMPYQQPQPVQYITVDSPQYIQQPMPTVVGTIITNGMDQIVLNNPNPPIVYPQQNNVYIDQPMIVGMETVVSNTVMSSSQFISGSVPGVLSSSYSATTTQVFQATKPVIDVPQSYVVVPNNIPNIIQNSQTPWNNFQVNYQESYKVNKSVSYQTVRRQIIHEHKEIDGVKMINSTQETILIEPIPKVEVPKETPEYVDVPYTAQKCIENPPKLNQIKIDLPHSSAIHKEKPQQAVAPVVVKKIPENIPQDVPVKKVEERKAKREKTPEPMEVVIQKPHNHVQKNIDMIKNKIPNKEKIKEEPSIMYEITSEDGFTYSTTDIQSAWVKVFETVQRARVAKGLPLLTQNPFPSPNSMLKKMMGLGNNSVKYVLEQLPGISSCNKYKPIYHKRKLSALEQEMSKVSKENISGCARAEKVQHAHDKYDMFSWLASRHRRPPKLISSENESLGVISRRAANMNLPMAMRFRHLKETSKMAVGVFRSDIHGRGLFCLRDIESGEMVIEYAGEVIRSALTDKRERFYTSKGIGCYMFRIDDKSVVDATMKGNAARFINHSCEPNCYSRVVDILGKKHILIFALRKILQGEELTYDYKFPLEEEKINCHCLSKRCRKYLN